MKSKKVTMLAAALVVAVVAAAGIGYATQYTAQTSNAGNTLDSTYIVLSETGGTAYTDILTSVYFNTLNTGTNTGGASPVVTPTTVYKPVFTHGITSNVADNTAATKTYAKISSDLTLTFDMSQTSDRQAEFEVTVSDFTAVDGITYTMLLNGANHNYGATLSGSTWDFDTIDLALGEGETTVTYVVSIYISVDSTTAPSGWILPGSNQHIETAGFSANGSTLTFVATAGQAA